ncbi:MAG: PIG-L family deacetylase [Kiritimatiellae bacterium]|nr:PIG-L family deacetylase [Kiritimatiellia bacterium]
MTNPYHKFVSEYARLLNEGTGFPLGNVPHDPRGSLPKEAPRVLMFSPHPDDECIVGALALRLLREMKMNVLNVAVTQGSRKDRQAERLAELCNACDYLGFGLVQTGERGLEKINVTTRGKSPEAWAEAVKVIVGILEQYQPRVIFVPHAKDMNSTHIGTHFLVNDALKQLDPAFCCRVCETEFWMPLTRPNLMIESSVADVTDLVTAFSFHVGEVKRNPCHLRLPAHMQDNVRRGGELMSDQGGAAPDYCFAAMYRFRNWAHGQFEEIHKAGKQISCHDSLEDLFG